MTRIDPKKIEAHGRRANKQIIEPTHRTRSGKSHAEKQQKVAVAAGPSPQPSPQPGEGANNGRCHTADQYRRLHEGRSAHRQASSRTQAMSKAPTS
jgi:hypothetical protein